MNPTLLPCLVALALCLPATALATAPEPAGRSSADVDASAASSLEEQGALAQAPRARRQRRRRPGATPQKTRKRRGDDRTTEEDYEALGPLLGTFWKIFPYPADYTWEVGVSAGTRFWETAYGEDNPNLVFRVHGGYRPLELLMIHGFVDYSSYGQTAGPLAVTQTTVTLGPGVGLLAWIGGLRLDLAGELGAAIKVASLQDGAGTERSEWGLRPVAGLVGGMGISLFGYVSLSLRGHLRYHLPANFDLDGSGRVDLGVLGGLEFLIGSKPGLWR